MFAKADILANKPFIKTDGKCKRQAAASINTAGSEVKRVIEDRALPFNYFSKYSSVPYRGFPSVVLSKRQPSKSVPTARIPLT